MYCQVVAHLAFENVHNVYFRGAVTPEGSIEHTSGRIVNSGTDSGTRSP